MSKAVEPLTEREMKIAVFTFDAAVKVVMEFWQHGVSPRLVRDAVMTDDRVERLREATMVMLQSANAEKSQPVETAEQSANDTNLLLHAVKIIRQFHAIPLADRDEKQAWSRYYNRAAEMSPIREALEKAGLNP